MDVGAIGGASCSAASVGATSLGSVQLDGVSSVASSANAVGLPAGQPVIPGEISTRLQALGELMEGFSSAEILLALMMMRGGDDKKSTGAGGALELLAGMTIAGQMQQMMHQMFGNVQSFGMQGFDSGMGFQIDFSV